MLAQNCLCPGLSTLFGNLLHSADGKTGSQNSWEKKYGNARESS